MKGINKKITVKSKKNNDFLIICANRLNTIRVYYDKPYLSIRISFGDNENNNFNFFIISTKNNIAEKYFQKYITIIKEKIRNFLYDEVLKFNSNKEEILNLNELDYLSALDAEYLVFFEEENI